MQLRTMTGAVAIAILLLVRAMVSADEQSNAKSYEMSCTGTITLDAGATKNVTDLSMQMKYHFDVTSTKRVLVLDSMGTKISQGGKTSMDYSVDRTTVVDRAHGAARQMALADMPTEARTAFQDFIGTPLCVVNLDSSGRETGRQILVSDAARRNLQGDEFVTSVVFFHPDPPPAQDVWTAGRTLSANGTRLGGTVTYKKISTADGVTSYAVSGSLHPTADSVNPSIHDYVCDIEGKQSFDSKANMWKDAKLSVHMQFTMQSDGKAPVKTKMDLIYQIDPITPAQP